MIRQTLLGCQRTIKIRCGAEGIRTLDPLVANQVLSQLSYSPVLRTSLSFAGKSGPGPS